MTRKIFKYALDPTRAVDIEIPSIFIPRHVGLDGDETPCIWIEVEPSFPSRKFVVAMVATGEPIMFEHGLYAGTFRQDKYIWHVYMYQR